MHLYRFIKVIFLSSILTLSGCSFSGESNSFTVTWKNEDGTVLETDKGVKKGEMPSFDGDTPSKEDTERYSYTFKGWEPEPAPISRNTTYTATYDANPYYFIYFNLDGGTSPSYVSSVKVHEFTLSVFFYDVTKDGYRFRGWSLDNERVITENGELLRDIVLDGDKIFKAYYQQDVSVSFTVKDSEMSLGVSEITENASYSYNSTIDLHIALKEGYDFVGWYINNELISSNKDDTYTLGQSDIEIEARLKYHTYELEVKSYNTSLGTVSISEAYSSRETKDIDYKSEVTISSLRTNTYAFLGWYDENNNLVSNLETYTFLMPNKNYSLVAKWDRFTVNYHLNGGTNNPNNPTYISSSDVFSLEDASQSGYDFTGWESNGEKVTTLNGSNLEDVSLEATFTPTVYQINYHLYGGTNSSDNPATFTIEDNHFTLKDPSHNDMYFDGWFTDEDFTHSIETISPFLYHEDIDLYAKWVASYDDLIANLRFAIENDKATVVGIYDKTVNEIIVPSVLETPTRNCPVVGIKEGVFSSCSNLVSITLPFVGDGYHSSSSEDQYPLGYIFGEEQYEGSTSVSQAYSLYGSDYRYKTYYIPSSLQEVNITNSSYLPIGSFCNMQSLTSIGLNEGLETIGEAAFMGCSISEITLPHSLKKISKAAFQDAGPISSITLYENIMEIADYAFFRAGVETITFANANKLTKIGGTYTYANGLEDHMAEIYIHIDTDKWIELTGKEPSYSYNVKYHLFLDGSNAVSTSVSISNDVTELSESTFKGCADLESVDLNNVEVIGNYAFAYCYNLVSINLDDCVTHIGNYAFTNCTSITSVTLANTLLDIGQYAFNHCDNLETITFEETPQVTHIGDNAFSSCYKLSSFEFPDSVSSIGGYIFARDEKISELVIPEGIEYSDQVLSGMRLMEVTLPTYASSLRMNSLEEITFTSETSIPDNGLASLTNLKTVTFLDGCTSIGEGAFKNCTALTTLEIPNGVSKIGKDTFAGCTSLASLTLADSVKEVDASAFTNTALTITEEDNGRYLTINSNPYYLFLGVIDNSVTSLAINPNTKVIAKGAIKDCNNLESLDTPFIGGGKYVEEDNNQYPLGYMFDCSSNYVSVNQLYCGDNHQLRFESFNIPKSLKEVNVTNSTYIPYGALYNCTRIENVAIENNATSIGGSVFYNCQNLKDVSLCDGLESIGSSAFYNCISLRTIDIPSSVTTLGDWCFYNCLYLYEVNFAKETEIIDLGNNSFANCNDEININFFNPFNTWREVENKKSLVGNVHYFNSEDKEVTQIIEHYIDCFDDYEFAHWAYLTDVYVEDGVSSIGYMAFSGCKYLKTVYLPASLTSIDNYAFHGCESLTYIVYAGTKADWANVSLGFDWNYDGYITYVVCSDGSVPVN